MIRYNPRGSGQITSQEGIFYKQDHIAYKNLVLAIPGLYSYHRMDDTIVAGGWILHDASPNGHDMNSAAGGTFANVAGLLVNDTDGAISSAGSSLVGVGSPASVSGANGAWSMSAVLQRASLPAGTQTFMGFGANQPAQNVAFSITAAGKLMVNDVNGSQTLTGATTIPLNQPVHTAATWDGTNLLIYLNGSLDASGTPAAWNNGTSRCMFADISGGGAYTGTLDELVYVSAAMSAGAIKNLFYSMQGR